MKRDLPDLVAEAQRRTPPGRLPSSPATPTVDHAANVREAWFSGKPSQSATVTPKRGRGRPPAPWRPSVPPDQIAKPHVPPARVEPFVSAAAAFSDVRPRTTDSMCVQPAAERREPACEAAPISSGTREEGHSGKTPRGIPGGTGSNPVVSTSEEATVSNDSEQKQDEQSEAPRTRIVTVALNEQQASLLDNLVAVGIYGQTDEAAAHFLIAEGLARHFPKAFASLGFRP